MASGDDHAIRTKPEGLDDEGRIHPAGAHDPDDADGRVPLNSRDPSQIGARVAAPIAEERHDPGLPRLNLRCLDGRFVVRCCHHLTPLSDGGQEPGEFSENLLVRESRSRDGRRRACGHTGAAALHGARRTTLSRILRLTSTS